MVVSPDANCRPERPEPARLARDLLDTNLHLTLGTTDGEGQPWVSPVHYAHAGYRELLWVSAPTSKHSHNIEARPQVSMVIFDSTVAVGAAQAVYVARPRIPSGQRGSAAVHRDLLPRVADRLGRTDSESSDSD